MIIRVVFYWCYKTYKKGENPGNLTILKVGEKFLKNLRLRGMFDGNENIMAYVYYLCSVLCFVVFCSTLAVHSLSLLDRA